MVLLVIGEDKEIISVTSDVMLIHPEQHNIELERTVARYECRFVLACFLYLGTV